MPKIEDLPFLNAITLSNTGVAMDSLAEALTALYGDSNIVRSTETEDIKKQLENNNFKFLIIDLRSADDGIKQFVAFCKKRYRELIIILMGGADDITSLKEFITMGVNAYVSPGITTYEFKVTLTKTFSGEKYVDTTITGKLAKHYLSAHNHN